MVGNLPRWSIGTTSACAENTVGGVAELISAGNYLRVRGEYGQKDRKDTITMELPPRARRIPVGAGGYGVDPGTTSACAENTLNELGLL